MKTDTQMDDVEEEREAPVPRKRERLSDSTSPCSLFRGLYTQLRWMHREDLLLHQSMLTQQGARDDKVLETTGARRTGTGVPRFQAGQTAAQRFLAKKTHQTPGTVDVAPMAGVQPETQGEAEEGEPPYKAASSADIVMVIDGETFCVPEEDVPKVYYEEDDGQVLPHRASTRRYAERTPIDERFGSV